MGSPLREELRDFAHHKSLYMAVLKVNRLQFMAFCPPNRKPNEAGKHEGFLVAGDLHA